MTGQLSFDFSNAPSASSPAPEPTPGRNSPLVMPDLSRVFWLFKKDKKGFTEMFECDARGKDYTRAEWLEFCDRHHFLYWSYRPYIDF